MNIAVDCRYLNMSGIGRVCKGIIDNFDYSENKYFLIGKKEYLSEYDKAVIIENESNPFSSKGLFDFPKEINKTCDLLLTPNFIIPFGIKIPVYSIIHDLIFLDLKKMTKNFFDASVKKYLLKRCIKKSVKVFCVSEFTKGRCVHYYKKYANIFIVNYNGLTDGVINYDKKNEKVKNSLVFVGNVKPHKGLKTLAEAFKKLPQDYTLKIIGEKDNFITGFNDDSLVDDRIIFTGRLNDEALLKEISSAEFLIQPSEYEGFGIPPLEALYLGTKPIVSDIPVFKEVYDGFDVVYFKVGDSDDLADKILNSSPNVEESKDKIIKKYNYKNCSDLIIKTIKGSNGQCM